jgi:transposase
MKTQNDGGESASKFLLSENTRSEYISDWIAKIQQSGLSLEKFYAKHSVPFSRSQYYKYVRRISTEGIVGIEDKRKSGGNRKVTGDIESFVKGCIASDSSIRNQWLRDQIAEKYGCSLSLSGITRLLQRGAHFPGKRNGGRPRLHPAVMESQHPCGGFELIIAMAYHLGWPKMVADGINEAVVSLKKSSIFKSSDQFRDAKGRMSNGRFTSRYNHRKEIRSTRFASIEQKRETKNWQSLNIARDHRDTIERKSMAILSLPVITMNGTLRTVDSGLGQALRHFAGFDYKQSSLTKYLNELKYVGVSSMLLARVSSFWRQCWGSRFSDLQQGSLQCYYIDGNTKPLWSSKRVKQNKVTMLGRVMGCLEHVFIHDCFGHPIYFETYSGNGVRGERILGLFDKIETVLGEDESGKHSKVCRVIVMDGGNNSVCTLRAFADQRKYHYITTLDENQWNERKIKKIGVPTRYSYGNATLHEVVIELEDSQEKGYLVETRAVKIDWDNGKRTVLMTSLPEKAVRSSEVVRSYFKRWPCEELQFRSMKSSVSLHRVAGYGKQEVEDKEVARRQQQSLERIDALTKQLEDPLKEIACHEEQIAALIPQRRQICELSTIANGKRKLSSDKMEQLQVYENRILIQERSIKKIEKAHHHEFRLLRKYQQEWLRLQGKERVYKVDVELDQILTFHRVSLANLYAYFIKHFLEVESMSAIGLLHRILHLQAKIRETTKRRDVLLTYNKKDPLLMGKLSKAIDKINALNIIGPGNKKFHFSLDVNCLN